MNDTNVIGLPASSNFRPNQALKSALDFEDALTDVLIIGCVDGELMIRSSHMSRAEALFLLEKGKQWAMEGGFV